MDLNNASMFFPAFRNEAEKWITRLGLIGWQVRIMCATSEEYSDLSDSRAICRICRQGRQADIILNAQWDESPNDYLVRRTAFHEVLELLIFRMQALAFDPKASEEDWEEESHAVIRTLENAVFNREYGA